MVERMVCEVGCLVEWAMRENGISKQRWRREWPRGVWWWRRRRFGKINVDAAVLKKRFDFFYIIFVSYSFLLLHL